MSRTIIKILQKYGISKIQKLTSRKSNVFELAVCFIITVVSAFGLKKTV